MFELRQCALAGCFEIQHQAHEDNRGKFVKFFHEQAFLDLGLETRFVEEYYSVSKKNVIRGLHFQLPPMDHVKMVFCVAGAVQDVIVDLRLGSPTYGRFASFELNAARGNCIYIPSGMAHGFLALSDEVVMVYKVSSVHSPSHDHGIRWDSVGIPWSGQNFIISQRDRGLPSFDQFESPFRDG